MSAAKRNLLLLSESLRFLYRIGGIEMTEHVF